MDLLEELDRISARKGFSYELFSEEEKSTTCKFTNNRLYAFEYGSEHSNGIRTLMDGRIAFTHANSTGMELLDALDRSEDLHAQLHSYPYSSFPQGSKTHVDGLYSREIFNLEKKDLADLGSEIIDRCRQEQIFAEYLEISASTIRRSVANSAGTLLSEDSTEFTISISGFIRNERNSESVETTYIGHAPDSARIQAEIDRFIFKLAHRRREKLWRKKHFTLILHPMLFYELFIEPVMENITLESQYYNTSRFRMKEGKRILPEWLTITDDPVAPGMPFSEEFDREGIAGKKKTLVEMGYLNGYLGTDFYSALTSADFAGNASGGAEEQPYSDSSNIFVDGGDMVLDGIFQDAGNGVIAERFSGYLDSISGACSGSLKGAFEVKDGAIGNGLKDVSINGNIWDMLSMVKGVSRERLQTIYGYIPYLILDL